MKIVHGSGIKNKKIKKNKRLLRNKDIIQKMYFTKKRDIKV